MIPLILKHAIKHYTAANTGHEHITNYGCNTADHKWQNELPNMKSSYMDQSIAIHDYKTSVYPHALQGREYETERFGSTED